jgi:glycosyltransferase involved in cell wall biosynthesis
VIPGAGVELDRFRPRPEAPGVPLALLAARLIWDKGVAEFVEAARIARRRGAEVRFALVGDTHPSNPRAVPEAQLRAWAAEGAVEWWGRRDDMDDVIAAAAIVCLPSTYGEGVPKVLLEALAAGRAVVATDIAGCRELIVDDENGLLVPPGDPEALAAAVIALAGDPARRARLGAAGRRLAEARLGVEAIARATLVVYRDALAPGPP